MGRIFKMRRMLAVLLAAAMITQTGTSAFAGDGGDAPDLNG